MRSLVLAALVACTACDSGDPDGAGGDSQGDDSVDGADASVEVDAPVRRDTSEIEAGLTCPAPSLTAAVVLGRDDVGWCFETLAADTTLTIVRGIQGGIHVELRLAVTLPEPTADAPPIAFEVEVVHDGTSLARFASTLVNLQSLSAQSTTWGTSAFPVVFASADASLYAGLHAELHAHVTLLGESIDLLPLPVYLSAPEN